MFSKNTFPFSKGWGNFHMSDYSGNITCKSVFMKFVVAGQELRQVQGQGLGQGFLWWLQKSLGSFGNSTFLNQTPNCFSNWRSPVLHAPLCFLFMESFDRSTIVTNTFCVKEIMVEYKRLNCRTLTQIISSSILSLIKLWCPWPQSHEICVVRNLQPRKGSLMI